jgi:hypothetical protein
VNKNTELLRNGVKSAIEIVREGGKRRTRTNTAAVVPSALMLRSNVAEPGNDIVEKGLAIRSDWSATVGSFRAPRALRDPAPPA